MTITFAHLRCILTLEMFVMKWKIIHSILSTLKTQHSFQNWEYFSSIPSKHKTFISSLLNLRHYSCYSLQTWDISSSIPPTLGTLFPAFLVNSRHFSQHSVWARLFCFKHFIWWSKWIRRSTFYYAVKGTKYWLRK